MIVILPPIKNRGILLLRINLSSYRSHTNLAQEFTFPSCLLLLAVIFHFRCGVLQKRGVNIVKQHHISHGVRSQGLYFTTFADVWIDGYI